MPLLDPSRSMDTGAAARLRRLFGVIQVGLRRTRVGRSIPALAGYLVMSAWLWRRMVVHLGTTTLGGGQGDPGLFMWWLRWAPFALLHGHDPLYTHYLNAPYGVSAMWNTSVVGLGVLFSPITELFGVVVTFNVLCVLGPALSAWTCSLWLRRHAGRTPALIGGLMFGFSPFVVEEAGLGHLMLTWLCLVPVMAMLVENILWRSPRPWWPDGPLLGVVVVAQLLIGSEVLVMTVLATILATGLVAATHPRSVVKRLQPAALGLVSATGVAAVLAAWPLYQQFASSHVVHGPIQGVDYWEAEPLDLVSAPFSVILHSAHSAQLAGRLSAAENGLYLGIPLLILVGVCALVFGWKRRAVLVGAVGTTVFFLCSLGGRSRHPGGGHYGPLLLWGYLERVFPLLENVLAVRLAVVVWLSVSLVIAVGLDETLARFRGWVAVIPICVVAACLVPLVPEPENAELHLTATPTFFTSADVHVIPRNSVVLVVPMPSAEDDQGMSWQLESGMWFEQPGGFAVHPVGLPHTSSFHAGPMLLNSLLSVLPRGGVFDGTLTSNLRAQAEVDITQTGATFVIVGAQVRHADELVNTLEQILGRTPDAELGDVYLWRLKGPLSK